MTDFQVEVDARNLSCPMPVMKAKKALKGMSAGEVLHVIATDPASVQDLEILLESLMMTCLSKLKRVVSTTFI